MGKRRLKILLCMAAAWVLLCGFETKNHDFTEKPEYLKSATYYSDDWVVNFWNSESPNMDQELAQIAKDGFNSIILALPWREFQPQTSPVSYNSYAWRKLDQVMEAAKKNGLWVELRVGYTWDYYSQESVLPRYQGLLYQESTKEAWLDYAKTVYERASVHPNFYGGFLTWEDFWNFVDTAGSMGRGSNSIRMAEIVGFQDYMIENYTLDEAREYYGSELGSYDNIYLPPREDKAFLCFYKFYDDFLNKLLTETQTVFPDLSMEVRLDVDAVSDGGEGFVGADHYSTFPCGNASYTSLMFGTSMGQQNVGEVIGAEAVLAQFNGFLDLASFYSGGKPLYVDQLLFMDTTEEFSHNASIDAEQRPLFLTSLGPVLKEKTMGYGIWTYRNYTNNLVFNSQFGLDGKEWTLGRGSSIVNRKNNKMAKLSGKGSQISQNIGTRGGSRQYKSIRVRLNADSDSLSTVIVTLGNVSKLVNIKGNTQVELDFGELNFTKITIACDDEVFIDNVNVYTYEQDGQLYSLDGEELSCIEAVRSLNDSLSQPVDK
ncbi:MAG: hypothetical protein KH366_18965 [Clostridiaceae bacterium]|nr:hypothetical protein [Clostridiaceae bacterium]